MRQAAERASALVRQLLALGHQQLLRLGEVDLVELLRELEPRLRERAGAGIELVLELDRALGPVRADAASLRAVLDELVGNACEAMPTGGALTLRAAAHEGPPLSGATAALSVSDTGAGMDEATCARVFEPFFTTKPLVEGAGLGLATVHGIVARSGGAIAVSSQPGAGTTFTVYLPLAAGAGQHDVVSARDSGDRVA
ncbi:MAG: ATP-binding protein [Thermoleophilia bacterium]